MRIKNKQRKSKIKSIVRIISAMTAIVIFCLGIIVLTDSSDKESTFINFINNDDNNLQSYPKKLVKLYESNKEAREFVLSYFDKKDKKFDIDLSEHLNSSEMPLFMQWDERWGYHEYAGNLMGLSGCGPTCLSMVAFHLAQDVKYTPLYMADFAEENGYYETGKGTLWTLFTEGARKLGFTVSEVPLWESVIIEHLENGSPIICNVGEGVFTESGHYIVFTRYENGLIYVNDPNRKANSKGWKFEEISDQIKNMWAISI